MSDVVLESFIDFCDNMQIAEEGFGDKIKNAAKIILQKIKTLINKIVVYTKSRGGKLSIPSDIYKNYQTFIGQAENLLSKFESKSVEDYEDECYELEEEYSVISDKIKGMQKKYPWLSESPVWAAFREDNEYEKRENKEIIDNYRNLKDRRFNVANKIIEDDRLSKQYYGLDDMPEKFQKKNADYSLPNLTTVSTQEIVNHLNNASNQVEEMIKSDKNEGYSDRLDVVNQIYKITVLVIKCAIKPA